MLLPVVCLLLTSSLPQGSGEPISRHRQLHPFAPPKKPSLWTEIGGAIEDFGGAIEDFVEDFLPEIP